MSTPETTKTPETFENTVVYEGFIVQEPDRTLKTKAGDPIVELFIQNHFLCKPYTGKDPFLKKVGHEAVLWGEEAKKAHALRLGKGDLVRVKGFLNPKEWCVDANGNAKDKDGNRIKWDTPGAQKRRRFRIEGTELALVKRDPSANVNDQEE